MVKQPRRRQAASRETKVSERGAVLGRKNGAQTGCGRKERRRVRLHWRKGEGRERDGHNSGLDNIDKRMADGGDPRTTLLRLGSLDISRFPDNTAPA